MFRRQFLKASALAGSGIIASTSIFNGASAQQITGMVNRRSASF